MIKANITYRIKCPNCGKDFDVRYKEDINGDVKLSCRYCNKELILYERFLKRVLNNYKPFKQSKAYKKFLLYRYNFITIVVIAFIIWFIVFWISEFRQGRMWIIFRY